jgi:serine/threonine protein kinase
MPLITYSVLHPKSFKGVKIGPYVCEDLIASGTFCHVYKSDKYAIKIYRPKYREDFEYEASILLYLKIAKGDSTHVLLHHDMVSNVFSDDNNSRPNVYVLPTIIFPLMYENLYDVFEKLGKGFTIPTAKSIIRQILSGLKFIHANGIVHTDLKPENIMLTKPESECTDDTVTIKIADFGSSVFEDESSKVKTFGTNGYISPEALLKVGFSYPTDIWSLGCIVFELITGDTLFGFDPDTNSESDDATETESNSFTSESNSFTSESDYYYSSDDEEETINKNYQMFVRYEEILGRAPKQLIKQQKNNPYFNNKYQLKSNPVVQSKSISDILQKYYNITNVEIESFIKFILQYVNRPSISEILSHKFIGL